MANGSGNVRGIDVAHYQGTVDWKQVCQSGIVFAIAKATDGITYTDPEFATNWAGIKAAGLVRGAYHFFEPVDDATSQAQNFLSAVQLAPGDLPPVLDVEIRPSTVSTSQLWSGVATWLQVVEQHTGRTPMIYTSPTFWDSNSPDLALTKYPLWLADYASQPKLPNGWTTWHLWQFSQSGSVSGVTGAVDLDEFNGTLEQFLAFVGGNALSQS